MILAVWKDQNDLIGLEKAAAKSNKVPFFLFHVLFRNYFIQVLSHSNNKLKWEN